MTTKYLYCHLVALLFCVVVKCKPPNIIFILADDYGYNDVGYHGSEIKTPNIDKLARSGVILENYYVQPICTPSRSQLMTGRYQIHTGLQHDVIFPCQPTCLPLDEVLLPEKLWEAGYKTHIVGKWHLGFYKEQCLPTNRGFDTHYGYYTGAVDYYKKTQHSQFAGWKYAGKFCGYDFHDNLNVSYRANGTYSTYLYEKRAQKIIQDHNPEEPLFLYLPFQSVHAPLEAPQKYLDMYQNISNHNRRYYAAMVTAMDNSIGHIVNTLREKEIFDETLIMFSTDNGGQTIFGGNNWPLRGRKATLWEGGVRGVGFVTGAGIKQPGRISKEMIHISDWFPTLLHVASGNLSNTGKKLDGFNVWESISSDALSPRSEILHNIDPLAPSSGHKLIPFPNKHGIDTTKGRAALRWKNWKLFTGYPGFDQHVPVPHLSKNTTYNQNEEEYEIETHTPYPSLQLYNIATDPTERNEVSANFPEIVDEMLARLAKYNSTAVPVIWNQPSTACNPAFNNGVWKPWPKQIDIIPK